MSSFVARCLRPRWLTGCTIFHRICFRQDSSASFTAGVVQHLEALAKKEDLTGPTPDEESEGGEQQQGSHGKGIFARWLGK